MDVKITTECTK